MILNLDETRDLVLLPLSKMQFGFQAGLVGGKDHDDGSDRLELHAVAVHGDAWHMEGITRPGDL